MPVPCFQLFLVSEKLHRKYSRNWTKFMESQYFTRRLQKPEGETRGRPGWPTPPPGAAEPWPRLGRVWPTWPPPGSALSPIYSLRRENPKYPSQISRKDPQPPSSSTLAREGSEALPGTLPERGIITGGLLHHHASLRSDV